MPNYAAPFLTITLSLLLSACGVQQFVGKTHDQLDIRTCTIDKEECRYNFGEAGYLNYTVVKTADFSYQVKGSVDLYMHTTGMRPHITFYVLFSNGDTIVKERKVKTGTQKADFSFEVTTEQNVEATTITNVKFVTWS